MSKKTLILTLFLCLLSLAVIACTDTAQDSTGEVTTLSPEPTETVVTPDTSATEATTAPDATAAVTTEAGTAPAVTTSPETKAPVTTKAAETSKAPEVTTKTPEVTTKTPEVTTKTPEVTTKTPEVTTKTPEVTTKTPEITTKTPEVTTKTPEVTTKTPEVTTKTPEVTTKTPEVTTKTPEVTTKTPEVTTKTPEVTTSPAVDTGKTPETHTHVYNQQNTAAKYLVSAADCTNPAIYRLSCSCGLSGTGTFESGKALGHNCTSYVYNNNATLLDNGTESSVCSRCKETVSREVAGTKLNAAAAKTPFSAYTQLDCVSFDGSVSLVGGVSGNAEWTYTIRSYKTGTVQTQGYGETANWGVSADGTYMVNGLTTGQKLSEKSTDTVVLTLTDSTLALKVNDSAAVTSSITSSAQTVGQLYIGGDGTPTGGACFDLYGLECRVNGQRVRVYIPVKRNSDGVYGLYDAAYGVFYAIPESEYTLFFGSSSVFDASLATFAADVMMDSYNYSESSMESIGLTAVYHWNNCETPTDNANAATFYFRVKPILHNGEIYKVYVLAIRGTDTSNEWTSDVNVGKTGSFHLGFANTADFIWNKISKYVDKDPEHNILLISGHSRGAAVGAVLSAKLMDSGTYFKADGLKAYLGGCPNYSKRTDVTYSNIFIFKNPGDVVAEIPPACWGLRTEGVIIELDMSDDGLALQNAERRSLGYFFEEPVEDYDGLTAAQATEAVGYLSKGFTDMSILSKKNIELIAELIELIADGDIDIDVENFSQADIQKYTKYFSLISSGNGDLNERYNLVEFCAEYYEEIADAHTPVTYWACIRSGAYTLPTE